MYDENGEAFGFNYNGNDYYYVRNAQNDVIFISNSDNTGVVMYQYDAWGNMTACYDTSDDGMLSVINPTLTVVISMNLKPTHISSNQDTTTPNCVGLSVRMDMCRQDRECLTKTCSHTVEIILLIE